MKVFVSLDIPETGIRLLRDAGMEVTVWHHSPPPTQAELIMAIKGFDALLCTGSDTLDQIFFDQAQHLKVISIFAAGYDKIDLNEAKGHNIPVGNAPGAMKHATADAAFGLMIAVSRKMFYMHKKIAKGEWGYFKPQANLGQELTGKTLGVFGLGIIGFEMAKRCKGAYDMDIIYCNRSANEKAERLLNAKKVDFASLLTESDVISVHCSLSSETKNIFNKNAFAQMKASSIFINTARGAIHNEIDLTDALKAGIIWGAGLDVTNPEPMHPDNPLKDMENVAITPHIGSATLEARTEMSRLAALNIIAFASGEEMPNRIA